MSNAPERIWLDPELVDSPRKTLACNFATATKEHSLPTDVEYVRADLFKELEATITRSVGLLGDSYYRERTQATQLQEAREAMEYISNLLPDEYSPQSIEGMAGRRARAFLAKHA
jgi:hypothetical protein